MRLPAIFRTTAARLSALYLLLFGLCAVGLVFYMTALSARMLTSQTQDTINEEVLGLANAYQRGGLPLLVRTIERRSRQPGANLYLIADANGRILSGNVENLAPGVLDVEGWTERPFRLPALWGDRPGPPYARHCRIRRGGPGGGDAARGDRSRSAAAQPDDRHGRPRSRRAGAIPRHRAARSGRGAGRHGSWRAVDLAVRRPACLEAHRQRFAGEPPHHGRRSERPAPVERRRRRVRPPCRRTSMPCSAVSPSSTRA